MLMTRPRIWSVVLDRHVERREIIRMALYPSTSSSTCESTKLWE